MADKAEGETVVLRMSADIKATITAAAKSLGVSLTTFMTSTALQKALQLQCAQSSGHAAAQIPSQFRTLCREAANGGTHGYATPGWHLAAILGTQGGAATDGESWARQVDALKALLANQDEEAAWEWFKQHFPHCMALVPARRREQFLYGVRRAYEEDLINA